MPVWVEGSRLVATMTTYGIPLKIDLSAESKDHLFGKWFNLALVCSAARNWLRRSPRFRFLDNARDCFD